MPPSAAVCCFVEALELEVFPRVLPILETVHMNRLLGQLVGTKNSHACLIVEDELKFCFQGGVESDMWERPESIGCYPSRIFEFRIGLGMIGC